ncbi:MAG TPA: response regulator [Anaeromyxobacter sp.]
MHDHAPIFVVDDDTDLREVIGELLVDEGYPTRLFENGRAALDLLRDGVRPRLILLDLMMPGMNGWQFRAEQLRDEALRDIPVVVMTASRGFDDAPFAEAEILYKPVGLAEILAAVERNALAA